MSWRMLETAHWVKTRKAHTCDGCGRCWPAGTVMETWTGVHSGDLPLRVYLCRICSRFYTNGSMSPAEAEFDGCISDQNPRAYIKVEAGLALYVIEAGVPPMAPRLGFLGR